MNYIILFMFSLVFTYYSRDLGHKLKIIDAPSPNKIHSIPIPRTGGLGILLTFVLGLLIFKISLNIYDIIFLVLIFILGFLDDLFSITQKIKFIIEIFLALIITLINNIRFTDVNIIDTIFAIFFIVGSINALNNIDGMDGLAGGLALISCFFMSYFVKDIALIVAIACFGFLIWNFHPAKLFMGDGGSLFLGAFIALMGLKILNMNPSIHTLLALIFIYSVPIYDILLTSIRRYFNKKSIFGPDLGHFYNKLYDMSKNYKGTIFIIYISSIILGFIGLLIYKQPVSIGISIAVIVWSLLLFLAYKLKFIDVSM